MAVFGGIDRSGAPRLLGIPGIAVTTTPSEGAHVGQRSESVLSAARLNGDAVSNLPATRPASLTFGGQRQSSFVDDYYNRVWVLPPTLDLGVIISDTDAQVTLWNANMTSVTLAAVSASGDEDVTLDDLPGEMPSLSVSSVSVFVPRDGAADVQAGFTFDFTSEIATLSVSGLRAKLWPYAPDWNSQVNVTYEFLTEIITSRGGQEQRIASRDKPRVSFEFNTMQHGAGMRSMISFLAAWQNRPTLMPDWSRPVRVAASLQAGDVDIETLGIDTWLREGATVAIIEGGTEGSLHEVRKIAAVNGERVSLNAALSQDMSLDATLYPCYAGRLATQLSGQQRSINTMSLSIKFAVDPGFEDLVPAGVTFDLFDGREVLTIEPSYTSDPTPAYEAFLDTVDYGFGRMAHFRPVTFNDRLHNASYLAVTRAEADVLRDLFLRQSGQQGEFYMPTFTEDLTLKTTVPSGSDDLRIEGREAFDNYSADQVYRSLIIYYLDGTSEIYRVGDMDTITEGSITDTLLRVVPTPSHDIDPQDVQMICWLPLWRFSSDQIVVQWTSDEVANVGFALKTLQYQPQET